MRRSSILAVLFVLCFFGLVFADPVDDDEGEGTVPPTPLGLSGYLPRSAIPTTGGVITASGQGFGDSPVVDFYATLGSGRKKHVSVTILSHNSTHLILDMPAATGKANQIRVNGDATLDVVYAVPYIRGTISRPHWSPFIQITGGNFNPKTTRVELSQTKKQRTTGATPLCSIISATETTIVCSVINLVPGPLDAVLYVNDVPIHSTNVATITDDTTSASTCRPPRGTPDLYYGEYCNCWSGYSPAKSTYDNCDEKATCAQLLLDAEDTLAGNSPRAPTHSFSKDTLFIKQVTPIGLSRRSTWINFKVPLLNNSLPIAAAGTDGASTCAYPGPLWQKALDTLDCNDVITAAMPWSQNKFCGFVQDLDESSVEWAVYKSDMVTKFVEVYSVQGSLYQRISAFTYLITVKFMTQKKFTSEDLSVIIADSNAHENAVRVRVTDNAVYDPVSENVLVAFSTTTVWPYSLTPSNASFVGVVPAHAGVTAEIVRTGSNAHCDTTQDSECTQTWFVRISTNGVCDIAGTYTFTDSLLCRDVNSTEDFDACPLFATPVTFSIVVKKTDMCADAAVDATAKLDATLEPYFDAKYTQPSDKYQTGDMIYWKVKVKNPQGTIDRVEFKDIEMSLYFEDEEPDVLYNNGVFTSKGNGVGLEIVNITEPLTAGDTAYLYMTYKLLRPTLTHTVGQLSDTLEASGGLITADLRTSVTLTFYFHGNQKRSENVFTLAAERHISVYPNTNQDNTDNTLEEVSELFGDESSASSTFVSCVVIFATLLALLF